MLRKLLVSMLVVMFALPALVSGQSFGEMTLMDKTMVVEKVLYGAEQTGSLVERAAKIEKDMYGAETKDALVSKLDRTYRYIKENSATDPSFATKLNAVEWALTHDVTAQPAKARIESLERILLGNSGTGSFDSRLSKLVKLAYPGGQIEVMGAAISKDALIKIKMATKLDTRTTRYGDAVIFQAAEDIYAGGVLVIGKGAQGIGKVSKVEQKGNFGRDAKLEIAFESIEAIDGTAVEVIMGEKAKEETKSMAKAAGATVAGLVILGPIGVVGGAFVHGQDIIIAAGTELYVQAKGDTEVYGIKVR
jgi:hypothetical protein